MSFYCIYLRKSRADIELEAKGEMETLARHKKTLLELAQALNLPVTKIYEEIVSGETIESRPVVQELLNDVGHGLWRGVLVMEIERLARGDTIDQGIVARTFKLSRAKIITPIKTYDPENEFDEEYFEFGLFMSRREYKAINRRIQRGRLASVKEGKFIGSTPPFGYDRIRLAHDKGYTLSPNEQADTVRMIFELYASGVAVSQITRRLDALGIKPQKKESWSNSTLNDMLTNPVYVGKIRWANRRDVKFIENGKIKTRREQNGEPILVKGLHQALVSRELFEKAQIIRGQNTYSRTKKGYTLQNPLSGLVFCKSCGHMMTRLAPGAKHETPRLVCPNSGCGNISAPLSVVEDKILSALDLWLKGYMLNLSVSAPGNPQAPVFAKALKDAIRERETIRAQMSNAHDLLEQGVYSAEVFTQRKNELCARIEDLDNKIKLINEQAEKQDDNDKAMPPEAIGALCMYHKLNTKEKNNMLKLFIARVEYKKIRQCTKGNKFNPNFELFMFPKLPMKK